MPLCLTPTQMQTINWIQRMSRQIWKAKSLRILKTMMAQALTLILVLRETMANPPQSFWRCFSVQVLCSARYLQPGQSLWISSEFRPGPSRSSSQDLILWRYPMVQTRQWAAQNASDVTAAPPADTTVSALTSALLGPAIQRATTGIKGAEDENI